MAYTRGKYAKMISDRSGFEFPYKEMVQEWNGSWVHKSEFEPKHPQENPKARHHEKVILIIMIQCNHKVKFLRL